MIACAFVMCDTEERVETLVDKTADPVHWVELLLCGKRNKLLNWQKNGDHVHGNHYSDCYRFFSILSP